MRAHHGHCPHELLHAFRFGGESDAGHNDTAPHDRLSDGHWREYASHIGEIAAHRYE